MFFSSATVATIILKLQKSRKFWDADIIMRKGDF
jgi:hypothetical protein